MNDLLKTVTRICVRSIFRFRVDNIKIDIRIYIFCFVFNQPLFPDWSSDGLLPHVVSSVNYSPASCPESFNFTGELSFADVMTKVCQFY